MNETLEETNSLLEIPSESGELIEVRTDLKNVKDNFKALKNDNAVEYQKINELEEKFDHLSTLVHRMKENDRKSLISSAHVRERKKRVQTGTFRIIDYGICKSINE